jgi:hypothetical protein
MQSNNELEDLAIRLSWNQRIKHLLSVSRHRDEPDIG